MMEIELIRSSRKTLSLQILPDGRVVVRAPLHLPKREIDRFVREKQDWIASHLEKVNCAREAANEAPLSPEDIQTLAQQALAELPSRTAYYARIMGVQYGRITIRNQKGRWGSCSSSGNLNFNCLLMLTPPEVQDYVIVHELAHRKQMNHSPQFWQEVEKVLPGYKEQVRWLKDNGGTLLARMAAGR